MSSKYYDDDEDLDIHVRRHDPFTRPIRYVQRPPREVRTYFGAPTSPNYLAPDQHTAVVSRTMTRDCPRSRDRQASPPAVVPSTPVIINNRFYNEHSTEDDETDDNIRRHSRKQSAQRRRNSYQNSKSRSRSRSQTPPPYLRMTRCDWEAELTRRELEQLRFVQAHKKDERRLVNEYRDEAELRRAKRELDEIKKREVKGEEEKRIKNDLEFKRLKEEEEAAEVKKRRDKEAREAVEKYKKEELERMARDEKQKHETEKEYKRRLQADLTKSGLDEKTISAILGNKKAEEPPVKQAASPAVALIERPTYTRMARRYLSIETLRTFCIEYELDADPNYVLVKRWVPEFEQDQFWRHTKVIREKRGKALVIEERKHRSREPEFEWVRKKNDRRRSKSPSLLMYLAGGRPA